MDAVQSLSNGEQSEVSAHNQPKRKVDELALFARDDSKKQRVDEPPQESTPSTPSSGVVPPLTDVRAAASEDKGLRTAMEDIFVLLLDAAPNSRCKLRLHHFGVFDGHGGIQSARFASEHLHSNAIAAGIIPNEVSSSAHPPDIKAVKTAITEDGATAVAVWVLGELVTVANVGDAKCVLARISDKADAKGQLRGVPLTKEHLAIFPTERQRIEKSGGFVSKDGRLNGRMQVSRSFGDAQFKKSGCSAVPDITAFTLTERDKFMLLGCDGFWGVFDPQAAVEFVAKLLAEGRDEKFITNRIINEAIRERRCKDNCTVMLVTFQRNTQPAL